MVCNPQCTPAPNVKRALLFQPLRIAAAVNKVGVVVTKYMHITRAEQIDHGKHLLARRCLQAKPSWPLLILLTLCSVGHAQSARVHRCIGENGEPTFSDQKCAALKAAPAAASPEASSAQTGDANQQAPDSTLPAITRTCAVSPEDLRDRVAAAFAAANSIDFSGHFLWDGFGQGSAIAPLRDLAALIREPLLSIDLESLQENNRDRSGYRDARRADQGIFELVIRSVGEQERNVPFESIRHFELREQFGCWWLLIPW